MRLALATALLAATLAGCTSFKERIADDTRLEGPATGDLGRELWVRVSGTGDSQARQLYEAVAADLEGGDLFDEVASETGAASVAAIGTTSRATRLELDVLAVHDETVHDFWRQRDGFVARYELECRILDRGGRVILSGPLVGIGYDDVSDPDRIGEQKRLDIRAAARRDAALKVGRRLRRAAEGRAREATAGLAKIHLPPGVGPVPIAALGFDDDPAARRRRGPQLTRVLAGALQRLGPDLAVVSPDEVEQELGGDATSRPASFEKLKPEQLDQMVPRLGARLYVVGKVSADGNRVEAVAWVRNTQFVSLGPEVQAVAQGPGALSLVAVELAQKLGQTIERNPPRALPRREESE